MKTREEKREAMTRESWIKNVMKVYPKKTREETEALYDKLYPVEAPDNRK